MRVDRTFAFVDLCGFTPFTEQFGDDEAVALLARFRGTVRSLAADHGVRVAKWLGDGVMMVSGDGPAVVRAVLGLQGELARDDFTLPLRAGLARGAVILFEGDDYTGRAVNLASRLADSAGPREVLATLPVGLLVSTTAAAISAGDRRVKGLPAPVPVVRLVESPRHALGHASSYG
jgi:class 3 adenylate cyclase